MGGCSSKPKTTEFEGAMDMQEEKSQDEAVRKSAEVERIGVDAGLKGINKEQDRLEGGIQNHIVEEEADDLRDMLAETTKHLNAGFDAEGEYNGKRQILEDDHITVKEVGKDNISKDGFSERQTAMKEETPELENGLKISAPASSQLHAGQILIDCATEHQETPIISNIGADTMNNLEHPERGIEMQDQPVMSKPETQAVENHTSHTKEAPHSQQKLISSKDDYLNLGNDVYVEAKKAFVLLDSAVPKGIGLELQKGPLEESERREVNLESKKGGHGNEGEMLVASPRQNKQFGTVEVEPQDVSKEARKGAVKVDSREAHENGGQRLVNDSQQKDRFEESKKCHIVANGACLPDNPNKVIGKEVLGEKRLPLGKDMSAKDEAIDTASLVVSANYQQALALECSCSLDGHVLEEHMQAKVVHDAASTCGSAGSSAKSQAEPISKRLLSVDKGLQKESTGEVVADESWYILEKVEVDNDHPSAVVLKEHIHMELPKNAGGVPREISRDIHRKLPKNADGVPRKISRAVDEEVVLSADEVADFKVLPENKEEPEAQVIHFLDPVGLAFKNIPAHEINAPDMDDVFEKLASEFERQESLSRFTS